MENNKTINLYTLEEAEKIIEYRRRKAHRRRVKEIKQKMALKALCFSCVVGGLIVSALVDFDNGGAVVTSLVGLVGLFVPVNAKITW